jgi:uncharacterized protein YjbI with pentapeptide repeats
MHGLQFKNCNLRGARFAGVDLSGANLTNSDLRDANLSGADLREADLEGANFAGADLTNTDFRGAKLNVVRFFESMEDGTTHGATVTGMQWEGAVELYIEQEKYLKDRAACRAINHQPPITNNQ